MMNSSLALHTAARTFCANQHSRWSREYMPLFGSGQDRIGRGYSKAAYGLFPRYRLDNAIKIEVERITITIVQCCSLEETRALLLDAGSRAFSSLLQEFQQSAEARIALTEEWKAFEVYIRSLDADRLARIESLPYQRTLAKPESEKLRQELSARWGVKGYWYPLSKCDPNANVVAFHQELWEQRGGTALLLQAIEERAIERCFLLLEGTEDFEIDQSLVDPIYRGDEAFITSDFQWLVYSSHESSITVAGWLADFFRARWQDWEKLTYGGPFHTADLRGTWDSPGAPGSA